MLRDRNAFPAFSLGSRNILQLEPSEQVTSLWLRWRGGDKAALDALMPLVYVELRRLARYYLPREPWEHTLQSTALVHEAYARGVPSTGVIGRHKHSGIEGNSH